VWNIESTFRKADSLLVNGVQDVTLFSRLSATHHCDAGADCGEAGMLRDGFNRRCGSRLVPAWLVVGLVPSVATAFFDAPRRSSIL
jgi:hypothetical protein